MRPIYSTQSGYRCRRLEQAWVSELQAIFLGITIHLGSICHQKPDLQKGFIADSFYVLGESRGCVEEHRGKETTAKKMDDMVKALHANACNYMLNVYVG